MRKGDFDPLSYIEEAFSEAEIERTQSGADAGTPSARSQPKKQVADRGRAAVQTARQPQSAQKRKSVVRLPAEPPPGPPVDVKLKATKMEAPRPRRRRSPPPKRVVPKDIETLWEQIPKNLKFLSSVYDDRVTRRYYTTEFKESREELMHRLIDPELNLEDASRLLGVCPATVRRYTNRGWLKHHRTRGNQRRFRLSGIVAFVEEYGRNPE